MKTEITLYLEMKQYVIIKKALQNYKGKLSFLLEKENLDLESVKRIKKEEKILLPLIENLEDF